MMPASTMSAFSDVSDLEVALRGVGDVHLIATRREEFRARVTLVELQRLRLWAVAERASRIGFLMVSSDVLLLLFPVGDCPSPIWSGISLSKGEILTCGPGNGLHMRTEGPSHWGAVSLPADEFRAYFSQLTGQVLTAPLHAQRWRPSAAGCRRLMRLHAAGIRAAEMRPQTIIDLEAAHGMEQQLIHSLVGCLSGASGEASLDPRRCQDVVAELENVLRRQPGRHADLAALRAELAISDGHLRRCCKEILGIGPVAYAQLYLADRARRASRGETAQGIAMQS
jgi:AraC-like DNA-binding protein